MEFRLATVQDLTKIKSMYGKIIETMNNNQIPIWDDIYPCEFFEDDIKNERLYILEDNGEIVSAFALCNFHSGENAVKWNGSWEDALYLDRLGVNVKYSRRGIGTLMLINARKAAKERGASCLRLFVVDINKPAINLYEKNGFIKANGIYNEIIDDEYVLHELGYECMI